MDNRLDLFEVKLAPQGDDDVILSLGPSTTDCTADDAVCTSGGTALTGTVTDTVPGPSDDTPDPLTAEFKQVPGSHDGTNEFAFRVAFSEELANGSGRKLRNALSVSGGGAKSVRRPGEGRDLFEVRIEPGGTGDVVLSLGPSTTDCTANDALCTSEGTALTGTVTDTVGYVAASVAGDADDGDAVAGALVVADGVTPDDAAAALFGERSLGADRLDALDRLGNRNGRYDLGDLLSWIDRCRRGEADCGGTSTDAGSAAAALPAAARGGGTSRRTGGRAPGRPERGPKRRAAPPEGQGLMRAPHDAARGDRDVVVHRRRGGAGRRGDGSRVPDRGAGRPRRQQRHRRAAGAGRSRHRDGARVRLRAVRERSAGGAPGRRGGFSPHGSPRAVPCAGPQPARSVPRPRPSGHGRGLRARGRGEYRAEITRHCCIPPS